ncbi:spinster family MFS transporter [Niveispirillum sp. KHB5.9]|uniref:spinster family MFS transporter n=1 Tax=Niveispirillum sp. KHB5.9 TaxID=3400269 RepID=UPI003A8B48B5
MTHSLMSGVTLSAKPEARPVPRDGLYAWYVTVLLTVAYAVAFVDRQILNLLVEPIKGQFLLTDTQISLLQGLAFTLAYVLMGPLFGRWTDIGNRRTIIWTGVTIWSVFTIFCGLSQSYWQLFGARMGVGGAEACLMPAAWSLLSDYFSKDKLPRAMSILLMGPYLGGGLALIFGGLIIQELGHVGPVNAGPFGLLDPWHLAFIVVGVPGMVLAALMLTVLEPVRSKGGKGEQERFTLAQIWHFLRERRGFYGAFYGGMSLHVIALYAFPAWIPSFLIRHYGVSMSSVGLEYGASVLIAGSVGVWCGPYLAKFLAARGYGDAAFRTPALATLGVVPFAVALPFCPTYELALSMAIGVTFFYTLPMAMAASALQMVTPNRMRGVISSLYVFTVSIVGLGLAPTFIALITDRLFGDPGMVGWSLALVCSASSIGASVLMLRGLGAFRAAQAELEKAS